MVLKLPAARVVALMEERGAQRLLMGQREMKEWVVVEFGKVAEYRRDADLMRETMKFMTSKG